MKKIFSLISLTTVLVLAWCSWENRPTQSLQQNSNLNNINTASAKNTDNENIKKQKEEISWKLNWKNNVDTVTSAS